MTHAFKTIATPVGSLKLVASDAALVAILWENDDPKRVRLGPVVEEAEHRILCEAERQLAEYFAGARKSFDLPLDFAGTSFQKRVWAELLNIPFGQTRTYAEIATAIGKPRDLSCGRRRKRKESNLHRGSVPPRDRQGWFADRLCWRPQGEGMPARDRGNLAVCP